MICCWLAEKRRYLLDTSMVEYVLSTLPFPKSYISAKLMAVLMVFSFHPCPDSQVNVLRGFGFSVVNNYILACFQKG